MFAKVAALAALAAVPALAGKPAVNVYFGQSGTESLGSYCESNAFEYVTVAFVNNSPEQDTSGLDYPGTNFAAHCAADVYTKDGKKSKLLSQCTFIADDIPKCQAAGKTVLLSVGGGWVENTNYTVSSPKKGVEFADFLWGAFGPYSKSFDGPRPFDFNGNHVAVDGFDFDIEYDFKDQSGYIALIKRLREHYDGSDGHYLIAGAPQCPLIDGYFQMKEMITKAQFDILWIQFYNNKGCDAIDGNDGFGEHFNYVDWELFLKGTASKDAKLFIGLLGSPGSGDSGYIEPEAAITLLKEYKDRPSFGGVMIWDVNTGGQNVKNGKSYIENIHDYLSPPDDTETTTAPITTTATTEPYPTSTEEATTTDAEEATTTEADSYPTEYPVETYPVETETDDSQPTETETDDSYPTATETSESYPTETETSESYPTATETEEASETYPGDGYPVETYPGESTSEAVSTTDSYPTTTSAADSYPTASETDDWCDDDEDDEPTGAETSHGYQTSTADSYPTTTADSYPTTTADSYPTKPVSDSYPTASETDDWCDDEDDEPTGAETSFGYQTSTADSYPGDSYPTGTAEASDSYPTSASAPMTTSTVYTTTVHTVTSCAPTVTDCPLGEVTTETIPWYTTVCPVEEETASPVTHDVIATVVPAPYPVSEEEEEASATIPGTGNYIASDIPSAFSTVTVANYPTQGAGEEGGPAGYSQGADEEGGPAGYTQSPPPAVETGYYPVGSPTPSGAAYPTGGYPAGGYPTAVVSDNSPVTAGAGRIAAALGVPAAMVAAMLVL